MSDEPIPDRRPLMRDLTGTWLGLYFLGTPFPHPWEPVARHAERNGYDRDGGIFKAAGDVYRSARRALPSRANRGDTMPLTLLDLGPLAYRQFVKPAEGRGDDLSAMDLSATVRALGACYEMLQLRLYIRAGGPIEHVILEDTLRALVHKDANNVLELVDLARHAYGSLPAKSSCQTITIALRSQVAYGQLKQMPGCVLAPHEGVYRSRVKANGGPNGNRLPEDQRNLYRDALLEAAAPTTGGHKFGNEVELREYLVQLHNAPGIDTGANTNGENAGRGPAASDSGAI
ncbi:hypothetical protein ASE11_24765 [Hydrogenophaga sp. Root209]|nr:hypothetical protein ASE11_24765 [Hydrogenophaga sp. Root209]